jgi:trans-aconitate methyltransferase
VYEYGSSLLDLLQDATEGSILDVGCGTGELTHALLQKARAGHTVVGIDADASMIARARQQYPDMTFHVQDVRTLQVQEPFDVVFSNAALHWVGPDYAQQAVQHLAAALKVGGKLIVEFGGKGNVESITQALRIVAPDETPDIWYFPSIGEFTSLLEHHGIEVLQASLFDRPTVLLQGIDSSSGIQNWLRMFANKYFEGLSEEETISILKKVEAKLRPKLYDGQQWIADYRRIRVVGRKV